MYIFMHTYHMIDVYLHVKILYNQCIHVMYLVIYDHIQHHILYIKYYIQYLIYYIVDTIYYVLDYIMYYIIYTIEVYGISYLVHRV